jgi:lysophospholipase L1-like esterase
VRHVTAALPILVLLTLCPFAAAQPAAGQPPATSPATAPSTPARPQTAPPSEARPRQNPSATTDWAYLKRYQSANAALPPADPAKPRVVFMGDSITQNWAEQRGSFFETHGYVGRGISGQTTSQMVLRFHQDVVALNPVVVAILAGTNDVAENTGPMTDEQILANLEAMTEMARAHDIKVVVGSVPPATYFFWRKEIQPTARIRDLNPKIKAWARSRGFPYADYWGAMSAADGAMNPAYAEDSVHPNAAGYAAMEPIVQAAIAEALGRK